MLIKAHGCALMLIDMQEKLLPLIDNAAELEAHCRWLMEIGQYLKIPILTTEQYPKGLGPTVANLKGFSPPDLCAEKLCFSGVSDDGIAAKIKRFDRDQWILIGIETHVCMLQTALELRAQGKEVFVVEDCTSARNPRDKTLALDRMKHHGVTIVSREMVVFEWLHKAGTAEFKHVNETFIK